MNKGISNITAAFVLGGMASMSPLLSCSALGAALKTSELRCEYLQNPLGMHETKPRLSWILASDQRNEIQTAYQVLVASTAELLAKNQGDLWDSGQVPSSESNQIVYGGKPLTSRQTCFWKIKVWGRDAKPGDWSKPAQWEMGLLNPGDWKAQWIEAKIESEKPSLNGASWIWHTLADNSKRCFRHAVSVPAGATIKSASILLSVDDQYTLFVNGKELGKVDETDGWRKPVRMI